MRPQSLSEKFFSKSHRKSVSELWLVLVSCSSMPFFLLLHAHHLVLGLAHSRCPYPLGPLLTSVLQGWKSYAKSHNSLLSTFRLNLRTFSGSPGSRHSLEVQGSQPLTNQGQRPQPSMLPRSRDGTQLPTVPCHLIRFLLTSVFCDQGKKRAFVCLS